MSGLDPKANRRERERAKAKEQAPAPLNPSFPFNVLPFDPWDFDLQNEPSAIDTLRESAQ